jgi:hypothetical protein
VKRFTAFVFALFLSASAFAQVQKIDLFRQVRAAQGAAVGDTYYTSATPAGTIVRLAIGSTGACYVVAGGVPSWTPCVAATETVVDDTTTNATMDVAWFTTNTGNLPIKVSSTKLTFNPSTGSLVATVFTGPVTALKSATTSVDVSAATAPTIGQVLTATAGTTATWQTVTAGVETVVADSATNATMFPAWYTAASGSLAIKTSASLTFNPSTGTLSATTFVGALTGLASTATLATNATNTAITDDTTTAATMFPTWVTTASSNQAQKTSSTKLTFNPSTGSLVATVFTGPVTALKSATTLVDVSAATAPTNGQTLTATSGTTATWQTPSSSSISSMKTAVRVATAAVLPLYDATATTLTGHVFGAIAAVDGVTLVATNRVLVKNETGACTSTAGACNNGIYALTTVGTGGTSYVLTRTSDATDATTMLPASNTFVSEGTSNANTEWELATAGPITVGTTSLTWAQAIQKRMVTATSGSLNSSNKVFVWEPFTSGSETLFINGVATDPSDYSAVASTGTITLGAGVAAPSPSTVLRLTYTIGQNLTAAGWGNTWGPLYPLTTPPINVSTQATTLSGNGGSITAIATSMLVASSTGFPATPFLISIGTEDIKVTTVASLTWTIVRAYNGTTGAIHNDGVTATQVNWEWVNQGTATATGLVNNGIFLDGGVGSALLNMRCRKRLIANTSTGDLQVGFIPLIGASGIAGNAGVFLRESGTGKVAYMRLYLSTTSTLGTLTIGHNSSPTTFVANETTAPVAPMVGGGGVLWWRVTISGANYVYGISGDGLNWLSVLTIAKTTQFTAAADEWGICVDPQSTVNSTGMTLISFKEQ